MTPERLNQIVHELENLALVEWEQLQILYKIVEDLKKWAEKLDIEGGG